MRCDPLLPFQSQGLPNTASHSRSRAFPQAAAAAPSASSLASGPMCAAAQARFLFRLRFPPSLSFPLLTT